jgi:hypothetical protein
VFTTVTIWLQLVLLPQGSVISHVCVMNCGQIPLVALPVGVIVTLVPQQEEAVGVSNDKLAAH